MSNPTAAKASKAPSASGGGASGWAAYFKGVQQEWQQITWPTQAQLLTQLVVVMVVVTLITLAIWGLDQLYVVLIDWITPDRG